MSTLTKVLIVLLTLSSIFLCGIVVTYVASADNFKDKAGDLKTQLNASKEKERSAKKRLNENLAKTTLAKEKLSKKIASLNTEMGIMRNNLQTAQREKVILEQRVNSWLSITQGLTETNDKQGLLLKNTLAELNRIQTEQIRERRELGETTDALVEKMAIIDTLEAERKQLLEEKTELQNRLDKILLPIGEVAARVAPVTRKRTTARQAAPAGRDISLKGLVTAVDMKNSMASISLGSADGIREGMKFHVTRGDEFLCNILIIDVDTETAVGVLELLQQSPRVGDNVSTNL